MEIKRGKRDFVIAIIFFIIGSDLFKGINSIKLLSSNGLNFDNWSEKMKLKQFYPVMITILTLMIAGCSSSSSNTAQEKDSKEENKKITLKVATYVSPTTSLYKLVIDPWITRATELTGGKVHFELYPGEQLGKAGDLLQLTSAGVADIGIFNTNLNMDNMPLTGALGLPNLSKTSYQGTMAYNDLVQQNSALLKTDYLKNGIRPIMAHVSPTYEIWTTGQKIRVPEDLKGLKLRTPGGLANKVYEYMDVIPVTALSQRYMSPWKKGLLMH